MVVIFFARTSVEVFAVVVVVVDTAAMLKNVTVKFVGGRKNIIFIFSSNGSGMQRIGVMQESIGTRR